MGSILGISLWTSVGAIDGLKVGSAVGASEVGIVVGNSVGISLGTSVGAVDGA